MRFLLVIVPCVIDGSLEVDREVVQKLKECRQPRSPTKFVNDPGLCPPESFQLVGEGPLIHRGPVIAVGGTAKVYRSTDGLLALKVPQSDEDLKGATEVACREKTIIEYIMSTGKIDFMPKLYQVDPHSVSDECFQYLVVSDLVGPFPLQYVMSSVGGLFSNRKEELIRIAVRLVEMVEALGSIGVSHNDLHGWNIVFSDLGDISGTLKIIDVGEATLFEGTSRKNKRGDLFDVMSIISMLSHDSFGNPHPQIKAIIDGLKVRRSPPPFREVIARLLGIDTNPEPIVPEVGIEVSQADRAMMKWSQVRRVREALRTHVSLEAQFEISQQLNELELEDAFAERADQGFIIEGQVVRFPKGAPAKLSTDRSFSYLVWWNSEFQEKLILKRLTRIFHENDIPTSIVLPDDWNEGVDLTVDAIMLTRNFMPIMTPGMLNWNVPRVNPPQQAAKIAVRLLKLLRGIHDIGMVQGFLVASDVLGPRTSTSTVTDLENIVLRPNSFARSFVSYDGLVLAQAMGDCKKTDELNFDALSPAILAGFCPGRFDDLYMLSEVLLWFIAGTRPFKSTQVVSELINAKRSCSVGSAPSVFNEFHSEMFTRSETLDPSRPDYEGWIQKFELSL